MFYFHAYGLTLCSPIMIPGYEKVDVAQHQQTDKKPNVDAEIIQGEVLLTRIKNPVAQGLFFHVSPDEIGFNVPNIARFLVQDGKHIVFDPEPGVDEDSITVFLSGPCFAALLMQRDLLVLTGSVLKIHDAAVAYLGDGCSGKSSLLAAMMQRGYLLMADGLCVVNQDGLVFPGPCCVELWDDSMQFLNIPTQTLQSIRPGFKKYRLPVHDAFYNHPLPLTKVYALNPQKAGLPYSRVLKGSEKINFLQKNIYNKIYLAGLKKNHLYFEYCARLAHQIKMNLVVFDGGAFNPLEIANCLEATEDACHDL